MGKLKQFKYIPGIDTVDFENAIQSIRKELVSSNETFDYFAGNKYLVSFVEDNYLDIEKPVYKQISFINNLIGKEMETKEGIKFTVTYDSIFSLKIKDDNNNFQVIFKDTIKNFLSNRKIVFSPLQTISGHLIPLVNGIEIEDVDFYLDINTLSNLLSKEDKISTINIEGIGSFDIILNNCLFQLDRTGQIGFNDTNISFVSIMPPQEKAINSNTYLLIDYTLKDKGGEK